MHWVLKLLGECTLRTDPRDEIRTDGIIDEYGEFDAYAEADFRARFADKKTQHKDTRKDPS